MSGGAVLIRAAGAAVGAVALRGGKIATTRCCGCGQWMRFVPCVGDERDPACGADDQPPEAVIWVKLADDGGYIVQTCDGDGLPSGAYLTSGDVFLWLGWCYRFDRFLNGVPPEGELAITGGCVTVAGDGCADDLCAGARYYVGTRCFCGNLEQFTCDVVACKAGLDALFDAYSVDCLTLRVEAQCPPGSGTTGFACVTFSRASAVVIGVPDGAVRFDLPGSVDVTIANCCDCCVPGEDIGCNRYKSPGGVAEWWHTYACPPNTTAEVRKYVNCCCDADTRQWTFEGTVEQILEVNCNPNPGEPPVWVEQAHINGVASRWNDEARIDYTGFTGASCGSAGSDYTYRVTQYYGGSCNPHDFPGIGSWPFNPPWDFENLANVILLECGELYDIACDHVLHDVTVREIITTDPPTSYQQYRVTSRASIRFAVSNSVSLCERECGGLYGGGGPEIGSVPVSGGGSVRRNARRVKAGGAADGGDGDVFAGMI